jgi:Tfp pilus assembly protein PilO
MTRKLKPLIAILRAVLLVLIAGTFVVRDVFPRLRENRAIERDIERATHAMSDRLRTLGQVRGILEFEEGTFRKREHEILQAIPPEAGSSELYQSLTGIVSALGLRLLSCTIGTEEKAPLLPRSAGIETYRIPIELEVAGRTRVLASLLDQLASLPRLVAVQEVTLRRDENLLPDSVAKVKLFAHYFDPPAGALDSPEEK